MARLHTAASSGQGIVPRPPARTYTLNDGTHRTRFGQMRPAFLLAMVFEIFVSMGERYGSSVGFVSTGTVSSGDEIYFYIGASLDRMRGTYDAMMTAVQSGNDYDTNEAKARNKTGYTLTKEKAVQSLLANVSAMEADEDLPLQISNYFTAVFANLKSESAGLLSFFPNVSGYSALWQSAPYGNHRQSAADEDHVVSKRSVVMATIFQQLALDSAPELGPHGLDPLFPVTKLGEEGGRAVQPLGRAGKNVATVGGCPKFVQIPCVKVDHSQENAMETV